MEGAVELYPNRPADLHVETNTFKAHAMVMILKGSPLPRPLLFFTQFRDV
jgi:hypothetical protein